MKNSIGLGDHFNYQKLLRFTIPSVLMMVFMSVFSSIDDGLFVSNFVGKDAFVAINLMAPILSVVVAIGFMISSGSSAIVAKTLGEGDDRKACACFSMSVYFTVLVGILLTLAGYLTLRPFCILFGANGAVLENCLTYGRIILPFTSFFMLQGLFSTFLITAEKPQFAMLLTILSGVINILFDILLMVILKLGIIGAVFATVSGAALTAILPFLYFLFSSKSRLRLIKTRIDLQIIGKGCLNGLSELISNLSSALVAFTFNYKLMKLAGNDGVASYGVIMYLSFTFQGVFLGYSSGVAPVVSFHFGAKNSSELKSLFRKSITLICIFGLILTLLSELAARPFASIFVSYDAQLLNMTVRGFRIYAVSLLFMGFGLFAGSFFTALNDALASGLISFIRTFILQIGTVLILPSFLGLDGIWVAPIAAEFLSMLVSAVFLAKGRRKYPY